MVLKKREQKGKKQIGGGEYLQGKQSFQKNWDWLNKIRRDELKNEGKKSGLERRYWIVEKGTEVVMKRYNGGW